MQLDVHVPSGAEAGAPWPVLAWVAGGGLYYPARLVQQGVIVVIVHHRLVHWCPHTGGRYLPCFIM